MQNIPPELLIATAKLEADAEIILYEIDLTNIGGVKYRFCNGTNELLKPVIWQGQEYEPYPIMGDGFEFNGKGPSSRPSLSLSNLFGLIFGIASRLNSGLGGLVTRRKTTSRFLDAINFAGGNENADPTQEQISRWVIEQLTSINTETATWELAAPTETDGATFPARVILSDVCNFGYRSEECGYKGAPVADELGNPTQDPSKDKCGKRLSDCKLRNNTARIGCFLSSSRLSQ
ncbi:phage minor tail protein L [Providencia heimbachae]|uniref:phage minor tail protein L n=1 Tax=Providencia heimbachae TaxID=333962 RepID=UPI0022404746|nr:phage minor tail protein L [Providencia heimbachae]